MVKLGLFLAASMTLGLAACSSCQPTPPPAGPPILDGQAARIYTELVEAGCLAPDDEGGVVAVAAEHALGDATPSWLMCLYNGGSITGCQVPCK